MKAQSLIRKVKQLGGTAELVVTHPNRHVERREVVGELNGYDVHMRLNSRDEMDYFTVRHISRRDEYDMGADYNPGGYSFCYRIKDLQSYAKEVA